LEQEEAEISEERPDEVKKTILNVNRERGSLISILQEVKALLGVSSKRVPER
jgi:hypothetical protein